MSFKRRIVKPISMLKVVDIRIVGLREVCMLTMIISRVGAVVSSVWVVVVGVVLVWAVRTVWTTFPSLVFIFLLRRIVGASIRVNIPIRKCQTKLIGNWEVVGKRFFLRVVFPCTQWIR